jgi:hypothetical protein
MNETGYQIRGGNRWERQSRASTLSNPCSGSHLAVFRTLLCRRYALSAGSNRPIKNDQSKQLLPLVGNIRETIAGLHESFAVLFSLLFSRRASNPERSRQKGVSNGTVSNRDLLSNGNFLSEISSALASGILDRTGGPYLSAWSHAARVASPSWEESRGV